MSELLSDDVVSIRHEEEELRKAFMTKSAQGYDPHRGLVSIFCPDHGIGTLPLYVPRPIANEGEVLMNTLRGQAKRGTPVTVKSMEEFESNFNREHPNVLHRLSPILLDEPVIIAGGSVLRALAGGEGTRTAEWWKGKSDIDLFMHCQDPGTFGKRVFSLLNITC
jgi:hypothetical protein